MQDTLESLIEPAHTLDLQLDTLECGHVLPAIGAARFGGELAAQFYFRLESVVFAKLIVYLPNGW